MAKLVQKQLRATLIASGLDTVKVEEIVADGIKAGTVSSATRGKIDVLRSNFPEFNEICDMLERFETMRKKEVNECMEINGFPRVSKMSVNVAK